MDWAAGRNEQRQGTSDPDMSAKHKPRHAQRENRDTSDTRGAHPKINHSTRHLVAARVQIALEDRGGLDLPLHVQRRHLSPGSSRMLKGTAPEAVVGLSVVGTTAHQM